MDKGGLTSILTMDTWSSTMSLPSSLSLPLLPPRITQPRTIASIAFPFDCSSANLRLSLVFVLSSAAAIQAERTLQNLTSEAVKYINPTSKDAGSLEEAFMTVPDLETIPYRVLRREREYEIRQVESYVVAETTMPGSRGFDFYGSSQGFNILAAYLFGKNKGKEEMEMTTPVIVSRSQGEGEKMEMTTPVITKQKSNQGEWQMAFVMPSKYGDKLPIPVDDNVKIRKIPPKTVAAIAFSGYVTDEVVKQKERQLRDALMRDAQFQPNDSTLAEVAQYNPPFTPPFLRRNEITLEVMQVGDP